LTIPPPNIVFNQPGSLANLSGIQIINVTVTDTLSQVDTVLFILINESEIVLNMTPSQSGNDFNASFDTTIFADGGYNITVFANDTQGNANNVSQVVNIDNTPPTILVVKPSNNSFVVNGRQEVGFNITDLVSGIDTSSINSGTFQYAFLGLSPLPVSSITFTPITDGFFVNGTVDLTSNEVEVNITVNNAKDNAGNAIPTVSWSYTMDLLNPAVKDLSVNDSDNKVKDADSLNITVNATGGISGLASVSVANSSSVAMSQLSTDLWSVTTSTSGLGCSSNGVCTLRFTATDNAGRVNDSETLTLVVDNINPSVSGITTDDVDDKVKNADAIQINVTVNDANFDAGSTVTVGNESTVAMSQLSSTLWSATTSGSALGCSATDGACTLTFTATDIVGNTNNSEKLTLTIDNVVPSVNSITINDSDNDVNNITVLEIIVNVTDTNAVATISVNGVALSPLSGDLWFVVKETLDLCPGILDNTCSLDVTASDEVGNVNDSEKLTLTVSSFAPVIATIPDITFDEDSHDDTINLASFIIDGDTLIGDITVSALGNNSIIVKIDQTTKLLNVSAKTNFNGQETLFFTVSDGVNEVASNAVKVTVTAVNDAPSVPTLIFPADDSDITKNSTTLNWSASTDIEDDSITYFVFFEDSSSPKFNTSTADTNIIVNDLTKDVTYFWKVIAGDGNLNSSESLTFQFLAAHNKEPELSLPIQNVTWLEDTVNSSINLSAHFTDPDNDVLTFSSTTPPDISVSINQATGIVTLTPDPDFNGVNFINFTASDGTNTTLSNQINLTVLNTNDAPILTPIGSLTATQGTLFSFDVNATDPDVGDILTFSSNSTLFSISPSTGEFSFTPVNDQVGTHSINFSVSDVSGLQDDEIVTLTVTNLNDAPTLDPIGDQSAIEDSLLEFNITALDIDGDSLTFTSNISISFTNAVNNSMATASFTPTNDFVGDNTVNITVSDGSLTDSIIININVENTNDAPTITEFFPTENKTIAENVGSQLFNVTFSDIDMGDDMAAYWFGNTTSNMPSNSSNVTVTGLSKGIYNITVIVNDTSGAEARYEWTLTVTTGIIFDGLTSTILEGLNQFQRENVTDVAINHTTFGGIDFGNKTMNFSRVANLEDAVNISRGLISVDTETFPELKNKSAFVVMKGLNFTKAPLIFKTEGFENTQNGEICHNETCTEKTYDVENGILRFRVANFSTYFTQTNTTNGAPIITSTPVTTAVERARYTYDVEATDPDGDTLIFSLITSPNGMSISSSSGLISWIPNINQLGLNNVTVNVSDNNLNVLQSFNITVGKGPKLIINDLDIKVDGKKDSNVVNNTRISKEAEPGSEIEFKLEIENLFTDDEDLEIEDIDIEITIVDIDDGDDLEEDTDEFDIKQGRNEDLKIKFDIPLEVDEGIFDVLIQIEGEDENGTTHEIRWELELEVEKESHEIRIIRAALAPSTISCQRRISINTEIINTGSDDEDDVTLEITSPELGISSVVNDIELDEGTDDNRYTRLITKSISPDVLPGTYPIEVSVFYDGTASETRTVSLEVKECELTKAVKKQVKEKKPAVEVIRPQVIIEKKPAPEPFSSTDEYKTLLAILVVLFLGTAIFVIGAGYIILKK